ncbi:DUF2505 domain-containing protein [Spongisporangium articulatum]|uniref:DUF2505 domain-containing protein n=1 Tax=Spongisporangium articulatum TaxID=3362603 RepID=A0ABW8ANB4_9ACTN
MPTSLDFEWELPYPPAALYEQAVKREFIEELAKATGLRGLNIMELEHGPEGGNVALRYEISVELPKWALKFVPPNETMTERRQWGPPAADGSMEYTVSIKLNRVPMSIEGVISLEPRGNSTLNKVHFDIAAQIAILGKKLEEISAADLEKNTIAQRDFTLQWMKTHS